MVTIPKGKEPYPLLDQGEYKAVCYSVIHTGWQNDTYQGKPVRRNRVRVAWELPEEAEVNDKPRAQFFAGSFSLNSKSNFAKMLMQWLGKSLQELETFDPVNLVGLPCLIYITKEPKRDTPGEFINRISGWKYPDGISMPPQVEIPTKNPKVFYSVLEHNQEVFDALPDWLKMEAQNHFTSSDSPGPTSSTAGGWGGQSQHTSVDTDSQRAASWGAPSADKPAVDDEDILPF